MNLLTIVLIISIVLTILSFLLVAIIVGIHLFTERQRHHDEEFLRNVEPAVKNYLLGTAPMEAALAELRKDLRRALKFLVELAETTETQNRDRLNGLFAALPLAGKELSRLKCKSRDTRVRSALLLGYLRDKPVAPALIEALADEAFAVRLAAARSLGRLGCIEAVRPIIQAISAPEENPPRHLAEAFLDFGPPAIPPIVELLNDPEMSEAQLLVLVTVSGILQAVPAVPRLLELLEHPLVEIRVNSVRALALIGDPATVPPISRLADSAWEVRNSVMHALDDMQAVDYAPLLVAALSDPAWWVRLTAAEGLFHLGGSGIKSLKDAAAHHADRYARDISHQVLQEHDVHHSPMKATL